MKFGQRWRIAGVIAKEIQFHGYLQMNAANLARIKENSERVIKQIKRGTRFTEIVIGLIIAMLAVGTVAAAAFEIGTISPALRLVFSISIFLGFGFFLVFFVNLLVTTGFFTSEAMLLPSTLPLSKLDIENLFLLAFVRVFLVPTVALVTVFPFACLYYFGTFVAAIALLSCAVTAILAIGALVKASRWYYIKTITVTDSKASTVVRVAGGFAIIIGMVGAYSATSFLPYLFELVSEASALLGADFLLLISPIFPFSFGILASAAVFGMGIPFLAILIAICGSAFYSALAIAAYVRSGKSLKMVALGGVGVGRIGVLKEVAIETMSPITALIRKDLKLATRNLGSMSLLFLPIIMVFIIIPTFFGLGGTIRSSMTLMAITYLSTFSGMAVLGLLMLDTQGASVIEGLPLSSALILHSKARFFTIAFAFPMLILAIVLQFSTIISPLLVLIPLFQIPSGFAVGTIVTATVYRMRGDGRAVGFNIAGDQVIGFVVMIVSALISLLPLVGYGLALLATGNHLFAVLAQLVVSSVESILAWLLMPRVLHD